LAIDDAGIYKGVEIADDQGAPDGRGFSAPSGTGARARLLADALALSLDFKFS